MEREARGAEGVDDDVFPLVSEGDFDDENPLKNAR